ncbi:MAG: M42 family metallopeptidase [Acholeplasmataceae bacterium]|jgi:endoglucanase|nr:M42 family metallopeptidase [Acholeplasmataceae bacterium]
MKKEYELLKKLSLAAGVPGNEKKVSQVITSELKDFADEIVFDNLGSVIAKKGSTGPKIMIAGHMDEIGLLVTSITKEGFIKFQTLGGWFSQVMLAQHWEIHTKKGVIIGVTGVKPPHLIPVDKRSVAIDIPSMFIDIGVSSKEEAEKLGVEPGNMIVPKGEFHVLGNDKYILSKAWDNRIGSAAVIDVVRQLDTKMINQLFATFTVQEEVGLRGAKTSSYKVAPEIAIAVDTGIANDVPGGDPSEQSLGKGPQILLYDTGLIPHQALRRFVIEVAKEEKIPYQEAFITGGRTDAGHMHLAHEGAASLSIGIPTRYMHSHTSIIHYDDYQNTVKLLLAVIKRLDAKKVAEILAN